MLSTYFIHPHVLVLPAAYGLLLWFWTRRTNSTSNLFKRKNRFETIPHFITAAAIMLAAAGFKTLSKDRQLKLVAAIDISDSIGQFDLNTQEESLENLLQSIHSKNAEVALVVFGETAGLERGMGSMPDRKEKPESEPPGRLRPQRKHASLLDINHISSVVNPKATDIGGAIHYCRGLLTQDANDNASRAILLMSDFRDTRGHAQTAASTLAASGIDLLAAPAKLVPSTDVRIVSLRVPEEIPLGRDVPIEVTIASQINCRVKVQVECKGAEPIRWLNSKTIQLAAEESRPGSEFRSTVRIIDPHPVQSGVLFYTAHVTGPDGDLPNDIRINNKLSGVVRIKAPSRWAVLTRRGSSLASVCAESMRKLGVETKVFLEDAIPVRAKEYAEFTGILADGLSSDELAEGPKLKALTEAVKSGKGLIALGGGRAFGAGHHLPDGGWEQLLPVYMTPEDDRTRAILFLIDVSGSMEENFKRGMRKVDFASQQISSVVQNKKKPQDQIGLITFSGVADYLTPLSVNATHFLEDINKLKIGHETDLAAPIKMAQKKLDGSAAEERLVILLSDGENTAHRTDQEMIEAVKVLCPRSSNADLPRRTILHTFGIRAGSANPEDRGEKLLKDMANAGGGVYSPDFSRLASCLEQTFEAGRSDYYWRPENFQAQLSDPHHPLLSRFAGAWPVFPSRNRVKSKPGTETLLWSGPAYSPEGAHLSRRPDPLLTISDCHWQGLARCAAVALSSEALLESEKGRALLQDLLAWSEAKKTTDQATWTLHADSTKDDLVQIEVCGMDPGSQRPTNGLKLHSILTPIHETEATERDADSATVLLHQCGPGRYRGEFPIPGQGVYRLAILDGSSRIAERFITLPYPSEYHRFGTDRVAMEALVHATGGNSRVIEFSRDLMQWDAAKSEANTPLHLRNPLLIISMMLLLLTFAARNRRPRTRS